MNLFLSFDNGHEVWTDDNREEGRRVSPDTVPNSHHEWGRGSAARIPVFVRV